MLARGELCIAIRRGLRSPRTVAVLVAAALVAMAAGAGTSTYTEDRVFAGTFECQGQTTVSKTTEATTSTTGALIVSGGLGVAKKFNVAGDAKMAGALEATTITETSDRRLKQNIKSLGGALDVVQHLRGVSYTWDKASAENKNKPESEQGEQSGFIAQEMEAILPGSVRTDNRGFKSIRYTAIIPYLVEAIKEQQKMITQLQEALQQKDAMPVADQVRALQLEVDGLKAQLAGQPPSAAGAA